MICTRTYFFTHIRWTHIPGRRGRYAWLHLLTARNTSSEYVPKTAEKSPNVVEYAAKSIYIFPALCSFRLTKKNAFTGIDCSVTSCFERPMFLPAPTPTEKPRNCVIFTKVEHLDDVGEKLLVRPTHSSHLLWRKNHSKSSNSQYS